MFDQRGPSFFELAEQALSSTKTGYDLLAKKFDYTPFRTPDGIVKPAIQFLAEQRPIRRAIDVCCGTGAGVFALKTVASESVTGVDFSQGMLSIVAQGIDNAPGAAKVTLIEGNAIDMPLREEFDLAVCFGALGHILPRDTPTFLRSVFNSLELGGRFAFVTCEPPPYMSVGHWAARGFNAMMRLRNAWIDPPFVMYYLTFLLPAIKPVMERTGFEVNVAKGLFPNPFHQFHLVIGTKTKSAP